MAKYIETTTDVEVTLDSFKENDIIEIWKSWAISSLTLNARQAFSWSISLWSVS